MATLVWLRDDLRLADNPALTWAASDPEGVIVVYIHDQHSPTIRPLGGAAQWWLHHSLQALAADLEARSIPLIVRQGPADEVLHSLITPEVTGLAWNRRYGPARHLDAAIKQEWSHLRVRSFPGNVLTEPWTITTKTGAPFKVYSPYWRAVLQAASAGDVIPEPLDIPLLHPAAYQPASESIESLGLYPRPDWADGLAARWTPGEAHAQQRLQDFLATQAADYRSQRDIPSADVCSSLSPYLRWGEISARTIWHAALASPSPTDTFLSEVGWRDFAHYTLYHCPAGSLHEQPLDARFAHMPWRDSPNHLEAWTAGETGYPLVDAGMQELWQSGFMHNRVRMITASFLTKNLLIDWREGERWFWDTLVDADEASNPFNWQWVAGCGTDAAPYFRIFNPEAQEKKFDPQHAYISSWAPTWRTPIVDLKATRTRALDAFETMKARSADD